MVAVFGVVGAESRNANSESTAPASEDRNTNPQFSGKQARARAQLSAVENAPCPATCGAPQMGPPPAIVLIRCGLPRPRPGRQWILPGVGLAK
ncbi:hypothetical protein CCHR01_09874 [Colletotrichum chrysophilum]|uniref:Uncharacterized protein n=1 Tax=Colletotrichum chrysophilum TaxID=1836956 RepID=A0AAD9EGD9_9PEZI|nr:hypothetical protein CCHR01_09874 [Colletotrichum chrysophilum]